MKSLRTVQEVLNYDTGECIVADDFFLNSLDELTIVRSELQKAIEGFREPLFVCYYCKQKIRIKGGNTSITKRKADILHFAHLKDSDECPYKTNSTLTKEEVDRIKYNGAKESVLHDKLKNQLAELLRINQENEKGVSEVNVEKVIKGKLNNEWKKPDINALYEGNRIALELQLSTTWLDVITRRQYFYKEEGIFIFWVFCVFDLDDDIRRMTFNDVIYTNNQNAYVFNQDLYSQSKTEKDLVLKCHFKRYTRNGTEREEYWDQKMITLADLTFDPNGYRIFFFDSNKEKETIDKEIKKIKGEIQKEENRRLKLSTENDLKERIKQDKIDIVENDISIISNDLSDLESEKKELEELITIEIQFEEKKEDSSQRIVDYFKEHGHFFNPFHHNEVFMQQLKNDFADQIKKSGDSIVEISREQETYIKRITGLKSHATVEISGKSYTLVDKSRDWAFIQQNLSRIRYIDKNLLHDMFAEEAINTINNSTELERIRYSNEITFFTDFSDKIAEINALKENNQKLIDQLQSTFDFAKKQIIEKIVQNKAKVVPDLQQEFKKIQNKIYNLTIELSNKKIELEKINGL